MFTSIGDLKALEVVAPPSPVPYILLFLIVSIIALILFATVPSLRKYRRKRNILVYLLLALALAVTLFQAYEVPRRTVYDYYINNRISNFPNYYPGRVNQFNLTCQYLESNPVSFYMVVNSVNVSFPSQPQVNVSFPINGTAMKVLFTVAAGTSPGDEDTKPILFRINENVTGFSFTVYPDIVSETLFPAERTYGMDYAWNGIENYYELSQLYQVTP